MLQNAYLLAKISADTAENEQHFAEIWPKIGNYPNGCCQCGVLEAAGRGPRAALGAGHGGRAGALGRTRATVSVVFVVLRIDFDEFSEFQEIILRIIMLSS